MKGAGESLNAKPWKGDRPPKRILAIRLSALGDTIIALPWLFSVREQFPSAVIDFLVLERNAELPRNLKLFDRVYRLKGKVGKIQFVYANLLLPILVVKRYGVIIDLQRNNISRWVRFWLFPKAWSEIERFSRSLAGEKFKSAIEIIGFKNIGIPRSLTVRKDQSLKILQEAGWNGKDKLIVLNPAGAFVTRNWPLQNYIVFANLWTQLIDPDSKYMLLGIDRISEKAEGISQALGKERTINLINSLTLSESFSVIRHAQLVLTEDSGLMHMAWVQRVPTLALFGSSPSYWSAPMGSWTKCLNSADLPCGNCLSEICRFGDVHCLTRISPEQVMSVAQNLLNSLDE